MGPMVRGPGFNKRKVAKLAAVGILAMFAWSLIAAPASTGADEEPLEPSELSAYFTFADAAPVQTYFDHQALPAPATGPALAHSQTEVSLPSQASAIAWLVDFGIANGLHGTTTGSAVPTEANAKQPGGAPKAEFVTAGGPIGEEEFGRAAAGVSRATAVRSDAPKGLAHAYFGNLVFLPAAGSPEQPPGTYDPDATFPGGDKSAPTPDPAPRGQMAIMSIGSVASTSESIREGDTVTSVGVAELHDINIGNRTSDNRCTNCMRIDALRVETFARTNGQPGGSRAAFRVLLGRACRRSIEAEAAKGGPKEIDTCIGNSDGIQEISRFEDLNAFFDRPLWLIDKNLPGYTIGIRIHAGSQHVEAERVERTSSPPEDACRNYAYPNPDPKSKPIPACKALGVKTGPDQDQGQEAKAVAEGLDIDILTITATQFIPPSNELDQCFDAVPGEVGCPVGKIRQMRRTTYTFGVAQASAVARPGGFPVGPEPDLGVAGPPGAPGAPGAPGFSGPAGPPGSGGGGALIGGLQPGKFTLKFDWSSFKIKPWPADDMAKGFLSGGIIGGMALLIRRRLRLH